MEPALVYVDVVFSGVVLLLLCATVVDRCTMLCTQHVQASAFWLLLRSSLLAWEVMNGDDVAHNRYSTYIQARSKLRRGACWL